MDSRLSLATAIRSLYLAKDQITLKMRLLVFIQLYCRIYLSVDFFFTKSLLKRIKAPDLLSYQSLHYAKKK